MCDLANERNRINQILTAAAADWAAEDPRKSGALIERCVAALEAVYVGSCVEECLRRRAEDWVAAYGEQAERRAA
ncbi:hypothetical protein Msil_0974 [Methylocella silvestris BL2]|uniref:Uncharacterized protein n=1 Tax=Methylocella silvestris (strain DSM 15510 / CIP 108128 / LMG 27833 / NCIMB 13906 / BL2) TaxID=395965 RepID=B8EJZ6_METSB|nr:hypothetical protein Msil_0974 [Methylocella silvestris BL2]